MVSIVTSVQAAFKTAMVAGAVALTLAGTTLGGAGPAQAFDHGGGGVRRLGGFHGGGFHRFGGLGHRIGGLRFVHRAVRFGPRAYGARRFAYPRGVRFGGYGFRRCIVGFRFVPGIGCRHVGDFRIFGYRPVRHGIRVVRPYGYAPHRFAYGDGRRLGGFGFRHRGGFGHHLGVHRIGFGGHHGFGGHGLRRH